MSFPFDPGLDLFAVADGVELVTVTQLDPDSGATLATSTDVPCLSPDYRTGSAGVGGGEVGETTATFLLLASAIAFTPKKRDHITQVGGEEWDIDDVKVGGFSTIYTVEATRERS